MAGIKIKLPLHVVTPPHSITTELYLDWREELRASAVVFGVFMLGSWAVSRWSQWREDKRIQRWKATNLATMKAKITETLLLIKNKADANQEIMSGKVVIWRAFYGQRSEIQRYIKRFQDKPETVKNLFRKKD